MSGTGKQAAAERAAELIEPGMRLGLGTGSTAALFVDALAIRVAQGLAVTGVPTSEATRLQAERLGIPLSTLDETPELDLTVDGADEIGPDLALIKGGGGALLREKLVAAASRALLVIADDAKIVDRLGRFPLPVEIVSFGLETTRRRIVELLREEGMACEPRLRMAAKSGPYTTDGGHWIVDLDLGIIPDPARLAGRLKGLLGVVEHGLFVGLATRALIGSATGVTELSRGAREGRS